MCAVAARDRLRVRRPTPSPEEQVLLEVRQRRRRAVAASDSDRVRVLDSDSDSATRCCSCEHQNRRQATPASPRVRSLAARRGSQAEALSVPLQRPRAHCCRQTRASGCRARAAPSRMWSRGRASGSGPPPPAGAAQTLTQLSARSNRGDLLDPPHSGLRGQWSAWMRRGGCL